MLGLFHIGKMSQQSVARYTKDSSFEDALAETKTFEIKVVESVFYGTQYVRSFRGLLILSVAIQSHQWETFWLRKAISRAN